MEITSTWKVTTVIDPTSNRVQPFATQPWDLPTRSKKSMPKEWIHSFIGQKNRENLFSLQQCRSPFNLSILFKILRFEILSLRSLRNPDLFALKLNSNNSNGFDDFFTISYESMFTFVDITKENSWNWPGNKNPWNHSVSNLDVKNLKSYRLFTFCKLFKETDDDKLAQKL